ncbi:hypothetical protein YWS52_35070 [Chitiniphilus shinanonensis]
MCTIHRAAGEDRNRRGLSRGTSRQGAPPLALRQARQADAARRFIVDYPTRRSLVTA